MKYTSISAHRLGAPVYGMMLIVLVYIGKVHELIPGMAKFNLAKIFMVATFAIFCASPAKSATSILTFKPVKYVIGIFLMAVASIPFGVYPTGSMGSLLSVFTKILAFFFLAVATVDTPKEMSKIASSAIVSAMALSVATLLTDMDGRVYVSNTYDSNDLAFVLVTLWPLVYFKMKGSVGIEKILLCGGLILLLLANLETSSRGGFLGLCTIGVAIYLKQGKKLSRILIPFLLVAGVLVVFAPRSYWDRMSTLKNLDKDYNSSDSGGRKEIWKHGVTIMLTHPLGVGIGEFETAEGELHDGRGKWSSPHNSFVQVGAELGFVGLYLFCMLLLSSIKGIRECRKLDTQGKLPPWLLDGIEVSLYAYITTGFFLSQAYSPVLYLLVALSVCARKVIVIEDGHVPTWRRARESAR